MKSRKIVKIGVVLKYNKDKSTNNDISKSEDKLKNLEKAKDELRILEHFHIGTTLRATC